MNPGVSGTDGPSYSEAAEELDRIIEALDRDEIDVDALAAQVGRAAELIRLCRERITRARTEVDEIVTSLEEDLGDED